MSEFDYNLAFSRNLGWITSSELELISKKKVAIAGMGGVGGHYAEILTRLGITKFHISDFDEFEVQNFNRQNGSGMSNLHKKKSEVIKNKILDINPNAEITVFPDGINDENIEQFLSGVDLYLDGFDFFVLDMRMKVFEATRRKNIPSVTAAPVGMGTALLVFDQDSMSFADHFGMKEEDPTHIKAIKFLIGLTPTMKHTKYVVDKSRSDFKAKKVPSLPMGPYLCSGVVATETLKIILKRGNQRKAPWVLHFDAYLQTYSKSYVIFGHKNPLQKIKFHIAKKILKID